jgi:hypothetical protein
MYQALRSTLTSVRLYGISVVSFEKSGILMASLDLGNFMVRVDLKAADDKTVAYSSRPVSIIQLRWMDVNGSRIGVVVLLPSSLGE